MKPNQRYYYYDEMVAILRRLKIKTRKAYLKLWKKDKYIPYCPDKEYHDCWEEYGKWPGFFGVKAYRKKDKVYFTWEEASAAARVLGISRREDYGVEYEVDLRLPSNPDVIYSDVWRKNGGWGGFLGTKIHRSPNETYQTWEEASAAAKKIGFKSVRDYYKRYSEDLRLPSNPDSKFKKVWQKNGRWSEYLGLKIKPRLRNGRYQLWEDASKAAQCLGIKSGPEYRRRYKEDPKLPSSIKNIFPNDWELKGKWYGFLGKAPKYETWGEAAIAARELNIKSLQEYRDKREKDPRLPADPARTYFGVWKKNGFWDGFLGLI